MSELSSFYARIGIKAQQYQAFLNSTPLPAKDQPGWQAWWDNLEMYSKSSVDESLQHYPAESIKQVIDNWKHEAGAYTFSDYDEENETWHFGIIFFSENFGEMIPMISAIRQVSDFRKADETDFIIIFPYFWEDDNYCDAYLKFKGNTSVFLEEPLAADIEAARDYLSVKWANFSNDVPLEGEYLSQ